MEDLIKGELDWHNKVNENFHEVDSQMADIINLNIKKYSTFNITTQIYNVDIISLLSALSTNTKTIIMIPNGTYNFKNLNLADYNVTFKGVNKYTSIILIDNLPGDGSCGIYSNSVGQVTFENLKLQINSASGDYNSGFPYKFTFGDSVDIHNCIIDASNIPIDTAHRCIHVRKLNKFYFYDNYVTYNGRLITGIGVVNSNDTLPTNIEDIFIANNHVIALDYAYEFFDCDNEPENYNNQNLNNNTAAIINNTIIGSKLINAVCIGVGFTRKASYHGNKIFNFKTGIDFDNPVESIVSDNIIKCETDKGNWGIRCGTDVDYGGIYEDFKINNNNKIHDNYIDGFNIGIDTGDGVGIDVNNNTIRNCNRINPFILDKS